MKLVGLMPARNEAWALGLTARVALQWCDSLVILDHASTDATPEIAVQVAQETGRVVVLQQDKPAWNEMSHRQDMLEAARAEGATHIAIIDADEVLTGNLLGSIRRQLESAPMGWLTELPGFNLRGGISTYHATGIWSDRWFATAFADMPRRLGWHGDRFHHREPMGVSLSKWRPVVPKDGGVLHLWGASERRLIAKHALYKMTETLRWPDKPRAGIDRVYTLAFNPALDTKFEQVWKYADVPSEWWAPYGELMQYLDVEAEPWQEAECRRLIEEHGAARFEGLDLFGVNEGQRAA